MIFTVFFRSDTPTFVLAAQGNRDSFAVAGFTDFPVIAVDLQNGEQSLFLELWILPVLE